MSSSSTSRTPIRSRLTVKRTLIAVGVVIALTLISAVIAGAGPGRAGLPAGFTVQHADGITYVCSTRPVYCTGNRP
jgi:hypothetical protein